MIQIKYKDYGSHVRARIDVDGSFVGSLLLTAKEFETFKGSIKDPQLIEIQNTLNDASSGNPSPED